MLDRVHTLEGKGQGLAGCAARPHAQPRKVRGHATLSALSSRVPVSHLSMSWICEKMICSAPINRIQGVCEKWQGVSGSLEDVSVK